ncbi:SRPBCC family protein [Nocardia sp. NPDC088792]|uniref:SRPBCC family protein n=1 Tax=Nocardia sp. NPDC088792 TaxID=3364332 RepID=UPI00380397EB
MTTFDLSAETTVERPASIVWALLADYANDTVWRTGVVAMTADPPGIVTAGARTLEQLRFAGRTWHNVGEVLAVEPGTRMAWRTTSGADAQGTRTVTPLSAERCRVHLELHVTPHGMQRPIGRLLARMLQRNLDRDVTALRELAERPSVRTGRQSLP